MFVVRDGVGDGFVLWLCCMAFDDGCVCMAFDDDCMAFDGCIWRLTIVFSI